MFGFFKRDLNELDYEMAAIAINFHSATLATQILALTSRRSTEQASKNFLAVFAETLVFIACLAAFRIEKKFKIRDGNDRLRILSDMHNAMKQSSTALRNLDLPASLTKEDIAVTKGSEIGLDFGLSGDFMGCLGSYLLRDYEALGLSGDMLQRMCSVTKQNFWLIKGAGWTLALLIFQTRTFSLLADDIPQEHFIKLLNTTNICCRAAMEAFERVFSK